MSTFLRRWNARNEISATKHDVGITSSGFDSDSALLLTTGHQMIAQPRISKAISLSWKQL
jgi:hypothetical protein